MPTFERLPRFDRDWEALDPTSQAHFREEVARFADELRAGGSRPMLPVAAIAGAPGVLEMAFAADARATISVAMTPGRGPHVIWRRIGVDPVRGATRG